MKHDKSDQDFSITALLQKIREEADASDGKEKQKPAYFNAAESDPGEGTEEAVNAEKTSSDGYKQERFRFRITRKKISDSGRQKKQSFATLSGQQKDAERGLGDDELTILPEIAEEIPEEKPSAADTELSGAIFASDLPQKTEDQAALTRRSAENMSEEISFLEFPEKSQGTAAMPTERTAEEAANAEAAVSEPQASSADAGTASRNAAADAQAGSTTETERGGSGTDISSTQEATAEGEHAAGKSDQTAGDTDAADAAQLSDDEFDAMLKRFLPDEEYAAYEKSCDLSQTNANMSAVRLSDEPDEEDGSQDAEASGDGEDEKENTKEFDTPKDGDEDLVPPDLDENDINLMIALGMDDELKKKLGEEKTAAFYRHAEESAPGRREETGTPAAEEEKTYTSFSQNKEIFAGYKKQYGNVLTRIAICAVLLLFAFFFENIGVFGGKLAEIFDPKTYPVVYVMTGLQLMLIGTVLVRKKLSDGFRMLLKGKPQPESLLLLLIVGSVLYDILMCFRTFGAAISLYHFPVLFGILLLLLTEFLDLRREIFSFHIVASKRIKYAIGQLSPDAAALETEAFEEYLPDAPAIFKLSKAGFIDRFYDRIRSRAESRKYFRLMLPLSILLGVMLYVFASLMHQGVAGSLTAAFAGILMTTPVAAPLVFSLPMYFASERAYETDSAIIGEGSVDEYDGASSVSFDDKEVFPSHNVKVTSVMVFGNNRIDEVIRNVTGVFHVAGGPLRDVLENITSDFDCPTDVRLLSVASDGIEAAVSGSHMYLGKADYLRRNHYVPILDQSDEEVERSGQQSIMFVVCDDEVVAKMYVSYRIDPAFETILKQLYQSDICVGIKTFDPNIDDDMLAHRIRLDKYPVRVLKCREVGQAGAVLEHTDSGIVSKHSARDALKTFTMCARIKRIERIGLVLVFISMFAGALITGMTLLFQKEFGIASMYVALYQFFWAIPIYLFAKAHVK